MIKLTDGLDFDKFLSKIENTLNMKIDPSSLDVRIFKFFYDISNQISIATEKEINSMFFENLKGDDLDLVMNFFDSYRMKGSNSDLHEFIIYNKSNKNFLVKKECSITHEGYGYKVLKDVYINPGENKITTIYTGKSDLITAPIFTLEGSLALDSNYIESAVNNFTQLFTNSCRLISKLTISNDIESDFEFHERSKSLMQRLGHSNSSIIKNEILKNTKVKDVIFEEIAGITKFTIIPVNISNIDEIMESSKHIVDYYKGGGVVLNKPHLIEINIEGLTPLIVFDKNFEKIKETVFSYIKEYLNNNFGERIYKNKIITLIQEALNQTSDTSNYDLSNVSITYNFFNKDNYDVPIVISNIDNYKVIEKNTVVTLNKF